MKERDFVKAELKGGLGNQLFIWAAGYSLSRRLNCDLVLSLDGIKKLSKPGHERRFHLDYFGINAHSELKLRDRQESPFRIPWSLLGYRKMEVFEERSESYDERFALIDRPLTLRGYFQSHRYFTEYATVIRDLLTSKAQVTETAKYLSDEVPSKWIAAHVRRGDYSNLAGQYTLPGRNYYDQAISLAQRLSGATHTVVFTDDPDEARNVVPSADQVVGQTELFHPGDVAILMSQASAMVGANSSLSWWAAFLSTEPGKPIFFPRPWYVEDGIKTHDLLYAHWQTVGV